jgi:GT2 family glycosyltransferase
LGDRGRFLYDAVGGKSRQLNLGLRAAAYDVVVMTDDDCRVAPGWLTAMAAPFEDPAVAATFGPVAGLSGVAGVDFVFPPAGPVPPVTWHYANGAAMAVRRDAAIAVGGFDERLGPGAPVHGEEHDIVLRLQEAGHDVRIADAPVVEHLEWRDRTETRDNLLVYSKGAGAFVGAALRRAPRRWARTAVRRTRYKLSLWRHRSSEGWTFGPATSWAYARGVAHGLRLPPRRFVEPDHPGERR